MILGHKFPAGHGIEEGEQVLDIVARAPQTATAHTTLSPDTLGMLAA